MNEELMECDTPEEMFKVIDKYYDLENSRPSEMLKAIFVPQLVNGIEQFFSGQQASSGTIARLKKYSSIKEILNAIADEYDLDFSLTPIEKQKLVSKLNTMLISVSAKKRRQNV